MEGKECCAPPERELGRARSMHRQSSQSCPLHSIHSPRYNDSAISQAFAFAPRQRRSLLHSPDELGDISERSRGAALVLNGERCDEKERYSTNEDFKLEKRLNCIFKFEIYYTVCRRRFIARSAAVAAPLPQPEPD